MAALWLKAAFPLLVCLVVSAFSDSNTERVFLSSTHRILGIQQRGVQKVVLRRLLALQETSKEIPPATEERQEEIRRVRRSWLSEYMNDLWSHVRETFPRSALYAFPIALGLMLVLCSITVLME